MSLLTLHTKEVNNGTSQPVKANCSMAPYTVKVHVHYPQGNEMVSAHGTGTVNRPCLHMNEDHK